MRRFLQVRQAIADLGWMESAGALAMASLLSFLGVSQTQAIDAEPLCSELFNTRAFDCSCLLQVILKLHASP